MGNKKRLNSGDDFSDSDTSAGDIPLNGQVTPPPPPPQSAVVKSPENLDSKHAGSDAAQETSDMLRSRKKRKVTVAYLSPDSKRNWSKDEELVILKGIASYRNETGVDYHSDSGAFLDYIKDDLESKFSRDQLMCKIRKLKKKFRDNLAKGPCFTKPHDSEIFNLSMAIWGNDKAERVDGNTDKGSGTRTRTRSKSKSKSKKVRASVGHEAVTKGEAENHDGSAEGDSFEKLPSENVDKNMEDETGGKESEEHEAAVTNGKPKNDNGSAKGDKLPSENGDKSVEKETGGKKSEEDGAVDELCALQDALETTMFQHLSNHAQKLMLQKLKTLGAKERKELRDEWNALLVQEVQLKSKKQTFAAKLAKAALDD